MKQDGTEYPPRVWLSAHDMDNDIVTAAVVDKNDMIVGKDYYEFLSEAEHLEIVERRVREARAEAFDLAAKYMGEWGEAYSVDTGSAAVMGRHITRRSAEVFAGFAKRERAELGKEGAD